MTLFSKSSSFSVKHVLAYLKRDIHSNTYLKSSLSNEIVKWMDEREMSPLEIDEMEMEGREMSRWEMAQWEIMKEISDKQRHSRKAELMPMCINNHMHSQDAKTLGSERMISSTDSLIQRRPIKELNLEIRWLLRHKKLNPMKQCKISRQDGHMSQWGPCNQFERNLLFHQLNPVKNPSLKNLKGRWSLLNVAHQACQIGTRSYTTNSSLGKDLEPNAQHNDGKSSNRSRARTIFLWFCLVVSSIMTLNIFLEKYIVSLKTVKGPSMLPTLHTEEKCFVRRFGYKKVIEELWIQELRKHGIEWEDVKNGNFRDIISLRDELNALEEELSANIQAVSKLMKQTRDKRSLDVNSDKNENREDGIESETNFKIYIDKNLPLSLKSTMKRVEDSPLQQDEKDILIAKLRKALEFVNTLEISRTDQRSVLNESKLETFDSSMNQSRKLNSKAMELQINSQNQPHYDLQEQTQARKSRHSTHVPMDRISTIQLILENGPIIIYAVPTDYRKYVVKRIRCIVYSSETNQFHYWMEGDNAKQSTDSRRYGFIKSDRFFGMAWITYSKEHGLRRLWDPSIVKSTLIIDKPIQFVKRDTKQPNQKIRVRSRSDSAEPPDYSDYTVHTETLEPGSARLSESIPFSESNICTKATDQVEFRMTTESTVTT